MSRGLDTFIRRVDHAADLGLEGHERGDVLPGVLPGLRDRRESLAPFLVEGFERLPGGVRVDRGVDRLEVFGDLVVLATRDVAQAPSDEVNDAGLHGRLREDRLDCLGEAGQAVHAADQDVLDAALLQIAEYLHPELGALGLLEPHAEHVALAVDPHPEREVASLALHRAALLDLQHERVEEHDRVDIIKRPLLPSASIVHHRVGHPRDQLAADVHAVELAQVALDIAGRQAAAVERQDLLIEPLEPSLALAHQPRLKAPVTVARRPDLNRPVLGDQRLGLALAVARITHPARRLLMRLITEMVSQLDLERPLDQPLGQLSEHPARTEDLLLRSRAGQKLVNHLIRKLAADLIRHAIKNPRRGRRQLA